MELSEQIKNMIYEMKEQFLSDEALLIPLLRAIQEEKGYISFNTMKDAALFLNLPLKRVREVATFYTMFNKTPVGKVHLQICSNISCWLRGADHLVHCAEKRLGIKLGETTFDKHFTLSSVECLAACGTAPVMQVNSSELTIHEEYYEELTESKLIELIDKWAKKLNELNELKQREK
ncbi:MAG: NAD(P)H-dependent oxidoreductase subunit E [Oligoflexia bacterium]|nr:NAD(P)H-dependent oxidoreductase subunit E [Oligoflexia bacterium]